MTPRRQFNSGTAFTLMEVMCSTAVLMIVLLIFTSTVQSISRIWNESHSQNRSFQNAQQAFQTVFRSLEEATLNPYWTTLDANWMPVPNNPPAHFGRMSELHFVAGPASTLTGTGFGPGTAVFYQAPIGYSEGGSFVKLNNSLNVCGFFVEHDDDSDEMPDFLKTLISSEKRYRLKGLVQPSEKLMTYLNQNDPNATGWFTNSVLAGQARPVGENIILLLIRWIYPAADGSLVYTYNYNSRTPGTGSQPVTQHQLPPRAEITMVALDEASAKRAEASAAGTAPELVDPALFTDPKMLSTDLAELEKALVEKKYRFHIFTGEVYLKTAKWSTK